MSESHVELPREEYQRLSARAVAGFDVERVVAWQKSETRKPACLAFTSGGERQAAYLIEDESHAAAQVASLTAQRDELLAAVKAALTIEALWCPEDVAPEHQHEMIALHMMRAQLAAAIAAAEQEA